MNRFHRVSSMIFSAVFVGIGVTMLVVTAVHGGGALGFLLGTLFIAAGAGRLYLLRRG